MACGDCIIVWTVSSSNDLYGFILQYSSYLHYCWNGVRCGLLIAIVHYTQLSKLHSPKHELAA